MSAPGGACGPRGDEDPLAGVRPHRRRFEDLDHGALKAEPHGWPAASLDRPSAAAGLPPVPAPESIGAGGDSDFEDRSAIPYTDADSAEVIHAAVAVLASRRCPSGVADPGARVSCLVSLAVEAEDQLHDAVADAAAAGCSWEQIAGRLNLPTRAARRRYGPYAAWRKEGCPWPVT